MFFYGVCGHVSILDINESHSENRVFSLSNYGVSNIFEH